MPVTRTNSLANAASAYLRSAAHQPIEWHEWGPQAFAKAQAANKPVLLDIGAVWCHWCHVMDRESYESPETAAIINQRFIAVKVDRDERPAVDARYQSAVSAISGQGGWPLTVFLTPEGKPFYGGTYFPPEDQYGRPGFRRILVAISDAFRERRAEVEKDAGGLMAALEQAEALRGREAQFDAGIVQKMVQSALAAFDRVNGGFGTAPKFPHSAAIDLLLDCYARSGEEQVGTVATVTLEKMARGGVYDQVAGGFHRYSVDERWCVPHFEKMAYDNSELLKNYVHAWQVTGNPFFAHIARDTMRWMDAWLSDREQGGFYASQDADISLDDDGDHFTWTRAEAQAALTPEEFEVAAMHWDILEAGEMHHNPAKNVLWVSAPAGEIASRSGRAKADVEALIESARRKLYEARKQRPMPFVDRTLYTNWNALCISAYLQAARALGTQPEWSAEMRAAAQFALRSLDRLLTAAHDTERGLSHVIAYDNGTAGAQVSGVLDDYAFTALACLDAYESTSEPRYFEQARQVAGQMIEHFYDESGGGFDDTAHDSREGALGVLAARRKPFQDAPTPAGNSAAAIALLKLHALTGEEHYRERARRTLELFAGVAEQFGIYAGTYGIAALWLGRPHVQVVVAGDGPEADALEATARRVFALNKIVLRVQRDRRETLPPALAETVAALPAGQTVALVCSDFRCLPPAAAPDELTARLREVMTQ